MSGLELTPARCRLAPAAGAGPSRVDRLVKLLEQWNESCCSDGPLQLCYLFDHGWVGM